MKEQKSLKGSDSTAGGLSNKKTQAVVERVSMDTDDYVCMTRLVAAWVFVAIYTLRDFTIDENSPETTRDFGHSQERRRNVPREHKSQSERDWAYAKRALARGDDPEVVIQRIADYRAEDKADSNYYARLTVAKAQAQLGSERPTPEAAGVSEPQSAGREPNH